MIYSERWMEQAEVLFGMITAAIAPGGALEGIKSAQRISPPFARSIADTPVIGFQYERTDETAGGLSGLRKQTNTFAITIVIMVLFAAGNPSPDIAEDAFDRAAEFANGRNGKGILPLLRANPTLDGTADYCLPTTATMEVQQSEDQSSIAVVYRLSIEAEAQIRV